VKALDPIDRSAFEPPYSQLARQLRKRIASGEFQPGNRLPSEAELCQAYGVSPMTVRRAVTQLTQEEVAYAEQGRGTFVKPPQLDAATFDLADLRRYLADPDIAARIVEARIVAPSARVRDKLQVDAGDHVIAIKRLLSRGEEAVFYHSEYLIFDPARPLVEAELGVTSLNDLFSGNSGSGVKFGRLTLHASALTKSEAGYLGENAGTLAWVVEHLFFDYDDRPLSWGRFVGRADRLIFSSTVGIAPRAEGGSR
jgi:DNA-binding GntR family transcriptional regulator